MTEYYKSDKNQYYTPLWAAEMLFARHFPQASSQDVILDPSCGDGRILMAIPENIHAYGVEIDHVAAREAVLNSRRHIITGDFCTVALSERPTIVIGNPPFQSALVEKFLDRLFEEMDYGGQVGFLLPVYLFQTANTVMRWNSKWSISQELVPRNLFASLTKPLMFAKFVKDQKTVMSGLFLYSEMAALESLKKEYRSIFVGNHSKANVWRETVYAALRMLGGKATLQQLYDCIENHRPTDNKFWREKIRQQAGRYFMRIRQGEYSLPIAA